MSYINIQRGLSEIISDSEFQLLIGSGKKLKIKAGFDPTAPDIHFGHMVLLNKLRQFQEVGHDIQLVIGDFTAMIGDPTGRNVLRKPLSKEEIQENARTYENQIFKILIKEKTNIFFNSSWFERMSSTEIIRLASTYTVSRMLERNDFKNRFNGQNPIYIHEFIYPLLQGYDSVMLESDIEIGGEDQKFNLIVGRELQKHHGMKPQIVLMTPLLEGLDGVKKMSKSLGNYIGVDENADSMFGKIMSISDQLLWKYIELLSRKSNQWILESKSNVEAGYNPMNIKKEFAKEMISILYGNDKSIEAEDSFNRKYRNKDIYIDMIREEDRIDIYIDKELIRLDQLLKIANLVSSTSNARRLIEQKSIEINGKKVNLNVEIEVGSENIYRVGKKILKIIRIHRNK